MIWNHVANGHTIFVSSESKNKQFKHGGKHNNDVEDDSNIANNHYTTATNTTATPQIDMISIEKKKKIEHADDHNDLLSILKYFECECVWQIMTPTIEFSDFNSNNICN